MLGFPVLKVASIVSGEPPGKVFFRRVSRLELMAPMRPARMSASTTTSRPVRIILGRFNLEVSKSGSSSVIISSNPSIH